MKKTIALAAALMLAGAIPALARSRYTRSESGSGSDAGETLNTGLAGKIGVGFDSIPGAQAGTAAGTALTSAIPGLANPNALDLRYWMNDRFGLDGLLALNVNSQPNSSETVFGLAGGGKYNLMQPAKDVLVQLLGRLSIADDNASGGGISRNAFTFGLFFGTGFEAFIPAWPALSVEGNVGLGLQVQALSTSGGGVSSSGTGTNFGIMGAGFSPISVSAHYYF